MIERRLEDMTPSQLAEELINNCGTKGAIALIVDKAFIMRNPVVCSNCGDYLGDAAGSEKVNLLCVNCL